MPKTSSRPAPPPSRPRCTRDGDDGSSPPEGDRPRRGRDHPRRSPESRGGRVGRHRSRRAVGRAAHPQRSVPRGAATPRGRSSHRAGVAAATSTLGPYEYDLRAGPQGEIRDATTLTDTVSAQVKGVATGSRTEDTKATGVEEFKNLTTNDIRIPVGTLVQTTDSPPVRFLTTEEKILPRSTIVPLAVGNVRVNIQAIDGGPKGNVGSDKITRAASGEYLVSNPAPATGGDTKAIAAVQRVDYDTTAAQADGPLREAGLARTAKWNGEPSAPKDTGVYGVWVKQTGVSPPGDVVNTEPPDGTFTITATGTATAYRVSKTQPRAAAINSLRNELAGSPGMTFDNESVVVDIVLGPNVGESGVQWRVRAKAQQYASGDAAQMRAALTGRGLADVDAVAAARGFKKVNVETWPSWWPRLPVLDSRITIKVEAPITAGAPRGLRYPALDVGDRRNGLAV